MANKDDNPSSTADSPEKTDGTYRRGCKYKFM